MSHPDKIVSVVVVEDEPHFQQAIMEMIATAADIECVGLYDSVAAFLPDMPNLSPDIFWLDINLQDGSGIELIRAIRKVNDQSLCLVCSFYEDDKHIFDALQSGAQGYILKNTSLDKMVMAIHDLYDGGSPISPSIARKVMASFHRLPEPESNKLSTLSKRETEVLEILAQGMLYKETADKLFISTETVKKHVRSIYSKLQVNNKTEAVLAYLKEKSI